MITTPEYRSNSYRESLHRERNLFFNNTVKCVKQKLDNINVEELKRRLLSNNEYTVYAGNFLYFSAIVLYSPQFVVVHWIAAWSGLIMLPVQFDADFRCYVRRCFSQCNGILRLTVHTDSDLADVNILAVLGSSPINMGKKYNKDLTVYWNQSKLFSRWWHTPISNRTRCILLHVWIPAKTSSTLRVTCSIPKSKRSKDIEVFLLPKKITFPALEIIIEFSYKKIFKK